MIAVDTSALAAVLLEEEDAEVLLNLMAGNHIVIGAPTVFELKLIITKKRGQDALRGVDRVMRSVRLEIVPWTNQHVTAAIHAHHRFGGRPARLNFGDCMAYAVAKVAGCPLLYKGGDFALTDVIPAR